MREMVKNFFKNPFSTFVCLLRAGQANFSSGNVRGYFLLKEQMTLWVPGHPRPPSITTERERWELPRPQRRKRGPEAWGEPSKGTEAGEGIST